MFWYQLIIAILEICKLSVVYHFAFDFQIRKKWYVAFGDLILLLCGVCYFTWWEQLLHPIYIYLIVYVGFSLLTFTNVGKWYRFIGVFVWTTFTTSLIETVIQLTLPIKNENVVSICTSFLMISFLVLILSYIRKKNPDGFRKIHPGYYAIFSAICFIDQLVMALLYEGVSYHEDFLFPFIMVAVGILFQMALVLLLLVSNNVWKEKQALNRKYLESQEKHYKYLQKKEEETKKFRHDIRNHLYTLDGLMRERKQEEFHQYMKKVFGIVEAPIHHVDTGNSIVDAILNQYVDIFLQEDIKFDMKGHLPVDCFVSAYDLCVIFSNMMQNALEAVRECEEKYISLLIRYDENAIYIQQKNLYRTITMKDNRPISNKKDKNFHGYGSLNIRESVNNYQGTINYEVENKRFSVLLYLQRPFTH